MSDRFIHVSTRDGLLSIRSNTFGQDTHYRIGVIEGKTDREICWMNDNEMSLFIRKVQKMREEIGEESNGD